MAYSNEYIRIVQETSDLMKRKSQSVMSVFAQLRRKYKDDKTMSRKLENMANTFGKDEGFKMRFVANVKSEFSDGLGSWVNKEN